MDSPGLSAGTPATTVLVVEDEPLINQAVGDRLRAEGHVVVSAYDGPGAVAAYEEHQPDLVVLDVMLPGFDGLEVCRRIQQSRPVPVLMLTARDDEADVLVGLGVGADDYLTKPFRMRELVARVAALLRRVQRAEQLVREAAAAPRAVIVLGGLRVDVGARRTWLLEQELHLTPTEFDLLCTLASAPGQVLTPGTAARRGLGLGRRRRRDPHGGQPREGAALQDRLRARAHGARRRLRAGGTVSQQVAPGQPSRSGPIEPLGRVTSIKVKLGLLVAASVLVASVLATLGAGAVPAALSIPVTVLLALGVTQLLAVGMTSPLRQMTEAARRMAAGDYDVRVDTSSTDEVGELARTFNRMAADLATVDRQRRDLVASVSHELRTPLTALVAVLENLDDRVTEPDPATIRVALDQAQRLSNLVSDLLDLSRVDAGRGRARTVARCRSPRWWATPSRRHGRGCARCRSTYGSSHPVSSSMPTGRGCTSCWPTCSTTPPGTARRAASYASGPAGSATWSGSR